MSQYSKRKKRLKKRLKEEKISSLIAGLSDMELRVFNFLSGITEDKLSLLESVKRQNLN